MYSTDNDFPVDSRSSVFIALWQNMLNEYLRELNYTALLARINFGQTYTSNSFGFSINSYNQNYFQFFAKAFDQIQHFEPSEEFYNAKRTAFIRSVKNR
jgi:secreted Zn-dependent insulinase-like peptidase